MHVAINVAVHCEPARGHARGDALLSDDSVSPLTAVAGTMMLAMLPVPDAVSL